MIINFKDLTESEKLMIRHLQAGRVDTLIIDGEEVTMKNLIIKE